MRLFRRERRSAGGGYTDAVLAAIESQAAATTIDASATAAAEVAAGLIGRSLALATVEAEPWAAAAITARWRRRVAYDLICSAAGHLSAVEFEGGRLRLDPASSWTWYGEGAAPAGWSVLATLPRPTGASTRRIPATGVVAVTWSEPRLQPWYGLGPLARARLTAELSARVDRGLGTEAGGQTGHLIVMPRARGRDAGESFDGRLATLDELHGKTAAVPPAGGFDPAGGQSGAQLDLTPRRIGANPPEPLVALQAQAFQQVLAACGVPPGLAGAATGTQGREDYRRFIITTVEPLADLIAEELTAKLETPVRLRLDRLAHADIAGRARAAKTLVSAGWTPPEAADAVGLARPAAAITATSTNGRVPAP